MKTVRSYLFKERKIIIRYPRVTFEPNGYDRWNMWHLLGWLIAAIGVAIFTLLAGMSLYYLGSRVHMKAIDRTPPQPIDAKREFVNSCKGIGSTVANVGSNETKEWECKKV